MNNKIEKATWLLQDIINDIEYDIKEEKKQIDWLNNVINNYNIGCDCEKLEKRLDEKRSQLEIDTTTLERLIEIREVLK